MIDKIAINEVFAIRDGESTWIDNHLSQVHKYAVMARSVICPGEMHPIREIDGLPVEQACIVAAQKRKDGRWQWMQLSPATKETLGDLIFDCKELELDKWYGFRVQVVVDDQIAEKSKPDEGENG